MKKFLSFLSLSIIIIGLIASYRIYQNGKKIFSVTQSSQKNSVTLSNETNKSRPIASIPITKKITKKKIKNEKKKKWILPPRINLSQFKNATVIDEYETEPDEKGFFSKIQLVQASFKYPIIETETDFNLDPETKKLTQIRHQEMVGDHIMIQLQTGRTVDDLKSLTEKYNAAIRKEYPESGLYLVAFQARSIGVLEEMIENFKSESNIVNSSEPDYIVHQP